jgi:sodium/proline symporter
MVFSFVAFMAVFLGVGLWSARYSRRSVADYLLAERRVPAWMAGLSAVATNNSGYMFIGMIGYTYSHGLSSVWLMIGWIAGDYAASRLLYRKLRETSERQGLLSFGGLLGGWHGGERRSVRIAAGVVTVLFLAAYAAAQFKAGSKALHVLLGWDYSAGAILGAAMALAYCFAGGIRASIWTDAAQSVVMISAMALLLIVAVAGAGGTAAFVDALAAVSPGYLDLFPHDLPLGPVAGPVLFVAGWLVAGFGVAGQPHIAVRFMAIDGAESVSEARAYYYAWFIGFYALTIGVGLAARLYGAADGAADMELALPLMAREMLPDVGVGFVLAGLFAATMSTADSQILSCTAAITQDVLPSRGRSLFFAKAVTVLMAFAALGIALSDSRSVFALVTLAWAALASAFLPLLTVQALGGRPSERLSLATMAAGLGVCVVWAEAGMGSAIYEIVPGLLAGFAVCLLGMASTAPNTTR